ncbi:MAG: FAD-dependent oxidoreductase [Kiritimatiellae bacterium]|nr:FAD-dependent oxidoreductase [Kiritimatiellia bacterium]
MKNNAPLHLRVSQVMLDLDAPPEALLPALARKLGADPAALENLRILRRSIDARTPRREPPRLSFQVSVTWNNAPSKLRLKDRDIEILPPAEASEENPPAAPQHRSGFAAQPIVIGAGPAGLFAALLLAEAGAKPLLLERGANAEKRAQQIAAFWQNDQLNPESNVLYGEGGAGLFSDGKLTARSKDKPRVRRFLAELVRAGAPEDILIDAHPHVGSDALLRIIPQLRQRILELGGEIRCETRLDNIELQDGRLRAIHAGDQTIRTDHLILATGHSARDVYHMLHARGVLLEPKAFAVGLRLELPQAAIDRAQWGNWAGHPQLGAASFWLTRREEGSLRACYSFCMCPGGSVIACASAPGALTTNGMSSSQRNLPFGNAAFLVPVTPKDYPAEQHSPENPLAGCLFQERMERRAFELAGNTYRLPLMRLNDFLAQRPTTELPPDRSCTRAIPADFRDILPVSLLETLRGTLPKMLAQLHGVHPQETILYAPETRSSSPVRIPRDQSMQSLSTPGLYPCGEGAGYGGGIVSSALDGMRAAEAITT